MNLKEIEYIVKIAEEGNVSHAAEKLFITPSALNQQLLHLEKDIGAQLFQRIRNGWLPTEAGEIYLEGAREILRTKKETYQRLHDIIESHKGSLTISFPPERGSFMFTNVYPRFHARYPDVVINVKETSVRNQQELIKKGEVDVGFVTLRENQQTGDTYLPIYREDLILALPSEHPLCQKSKIKGNKKYGELSLSALQNETFAFMSKESTIYDCIRQLFRDAGFVTSILFETARASTILEMVSAGLCCSIVPDSDSLKHIPGVSFFYLDTHPSWNMMASYQKGSYLSKPAKYFIQLATEYWKSCKEGLTI